MEDEPFEIDFPRTEYYTVRKNLMNNVGEPAKLSECRCSLGDVLATLIFTYCPDGLTEKFGLDKPLIGPRHDLWCSPSDLLEGKVCLKPPFSRKYIQALTHEGIIEMGWEIEKKFFKEMEAHKEAALVAQKAKFNEAFDTQLRQNLKDYEVQTRMECERKMNNLADEFEIQLVQELEAFERKLRKEFECEKMCLLAKHQQEVNSSLLQAVSTTVKELTKSFIAQLTLQKHRMNKEFEYEMQKAEIRKHFDLKRRDAYCAEALKHLEHNLECRNIANMMYVICRERRKCVKEREDLMNSHQAEINALKMTNEKKNARIKSLVKENKEKTRHLQIKTAAVTQLVHQFQKFIAFALKAVPTQAEFLLSLDKMLLFELNDVLKDAKVDKRELAPGIIPWLFTEPPPADSEASENDLIINDFHNCLREVEVPLKPDEEPEFLPAFNYKDNLYVRQDFRNMLSQGLEMKEDNKLWSKDVEEVIKKIGKLPEKKHSFSDIGPTSSKISVRFSNKKRTSLAKTNGSNINIKHQKPLLKNLNDLENINFMDYIDVHSAKLSILGSRNSLEVIRKRLGQETRSDEDSSAPPNEVTKDIKMYRESQKLYEEYHEKASQEPAVTAMETLSLSKVSSPPSSSTSMAEDRVPSKLMLARDSLVLHRTSIMKKQSNLFLISPKDSLSLNAEKLTGTRQVRKTLSCTHQPKLTQARDSLQLIKDLESEGSIIGKCSSKKACNMCDDEDETNDNLAEIIKAAIEARRKQRKEESFCKVLPRFSIERRNSKKAALIPCGSTVAFATEEHVVIEAKTDYEMERDYEKKLKMKVAETKRGKRKKIKRAKMRNYTKVVGDGNDKSGEQEPEIFTKERIHSLVSLIKEYPDLIALFTAGVR